MALDPTKYDVPLSGSRWDRTLFRLEHWLLTPGRTPVGELRGYLRVKTWRDARSARERLHAVKLATKLPARALRDSWKAVREHGERVAHEDGIPRHQQLAQLWWLWVRHGVHPPVYYAFRLYRPGQLRRAPAFFQGDEDDWLFRLANVRMARGDAELLLDKAWCERWLLDRGLPTVPTLLELAGGTTVRSSLPGGRLPRCDLFSKPKDSLQGRGAQSWRFDGEGWVGMDGRRRNEAELLAELTEASRTQGVLLQEQLRNHPALAPIASATLSTVRVLTLRGLDDVVRVVLAVAKIPVGNAPTDHMKYGGLAAPVELATGRLQRAIAKSKTAYVAPCERHPDSGAVLEGFQLPHWERVLQLAVRAHELLPRIVCVGWDVAILESGPIIIEGNDNPGHTSSQLPTGVALGETPVVPTLLARIRESFAAAGPISPRDARPAQPVRPIGDAVVSPQV
ncbi:MAG TPA: sugar-transfer associated ATP-grasp domain-containing protein [Gemmatimonadaceae bacterium]|nr:sugar-transfer associated ATP-grasp domain-containing protein [Gemmatimonadaceae bacterium]